MDMTRKSIAFLVREWYLRIFKEVSEQKIGHWYSDTSDLCSYNNISLPSHERVARQRFKASSRDGNCPTNDEILRCLRDSNKNFHTILSGYADTLRKSWNSVESLPFGIQNLFFVFEFTVRCSRGDRWSLPIVFCCRSANDQGLLLVATKSKVNG